MKTTFPLFALGLTAILITGCAPEDWKLGPFERYEKNPILVPSDRYWEAKDLFNPTAWTDGETVYLLYRAEDTTGVGMWNGTSRVGLAMSTNGLDFEREPEPVLSPTDPWELPGGCEDPRVVKIDSLFYMTYTGYDGQTARLGLATSPDLRTWTKHGPLFPARGWTKSGAILDTPVDGRYWMYFGDTNIWVAHSKDLLHWTVVEEPVLKPRPGFFDSRLVEPGPQPILTEHGIVLLYNGARVEDTAYGAGQALSRCQRSHPAPRPHNRTLPHPPNQHGKVRASLKRRVCRRTGPLQRPLDAVLRRR